MYISRRLIALPTTYYLDQLTSVVEDFRKKIRNALTKIYLVKISLLRKFKRCYLIKDHTYLCYE